MKILPPGVRTRLLSAGVLAAALGLLTPVAVDRGPSGRDTSTSANERVGRRDVVVRGLPGAADDVRRAVLAVGGTVERRLPIIDGVAASVPDPAIVALARMRGVAGVTPDGKLRPMAVDANLGYDPQTTGSMSAITRITGAQAAWEAGITGRGVDVAVIDTGVMKVEGLATAGKVVDGPDLSFDGASEYAHRDTYGHGTHMAGIIAGRDSGVTSSLTRVACSTCTNRSMLSDATKFVGMAPDARLVSVRVGATDGATDVSQVIAALDWVVKHRRSADLNVKVINLSYGTDSTQDYVLDPLSFAAENAMRKGILVVASGGNDGSDVPTLASPAFNPFVLAVGATAPNDTLDRGDDTVPAFATRSTNKRNVDVVAPGVSVLSLRSPGSFIEETFAPTIVGTRFVPGSGTSQAAAVTTGAAALLFQKFPTATAQDVKALLVENAHSFARANGKPEQGKGQIDVATAITKKPGSKAASVERSTGRGSLEAARGSVNVADGDVVLTGEKDVFGKGWNGGVWAADSAGERSWQGGAWRGSRWTGATWLTPSTWADTAEPDLNWAGSRWSGSRWSGMAWDGSRWSGSRWSGSRWSGSRWSGSRWSDAGWSSAGWA